MYRMQCYEDNHETTSSSPSSSLALSYPARVNVGDMVYCRVNVSTHVWDPRLQLVVPNCSFTTGPPDMNYSMAYQFIVNKYVIHTQWGHVRSSV